MVTVMDREYIGEEYFMAIQNLGTELKIVSIMTKNVENSKMSGPRRLFGQLEVPRAQSFEKPLSTSHTRIDSVLGELKVLFRI
jgi:hypothetical protein